MWIHADIWFDRLLNIERPGTGIVRDELSAYVVLSTANALLPEGQCLEVTIENIPN
jgi:hypothetical protein